MASVTTSLPWISSSNDIHSDSGLDPSSWESLTISHILLPVFCAVFISLVVVVIACCLIQRKPKSAGNWRKKSCHTIETSHETSDIGVYDVIDEVNVSACTPEKAARHRTKLDSDYILGSNLLRHSKTDDVFPAANVSMSIPFHAAQSFPAGTLKLPPHPRRNVNYTGQVSASGESYAQKRPDCSDLLNQDERIYETLDRHAILRNEGNEHSTLPSIDRSLSFYHRDMNQHMNVSRDSLQSNNMYETLKWKPECEKSCSMCNSPKDNGVKDACQNLHTGTPSSQTDQSNKIVCQFSVFKVSGTQEKATLIDKAYYRVKSQTTPCVCSGSQDISTMFQNRSLRLAHHSFRERSPECGNGHDLILKPVTDAGCYVNNSRDSNTFANNLEKILMSQQSTVDPQRYPEPSAKQYENLKVTSSVVCASILPEHCGHSSRGYNMSLPFQRSEFHTKYSDSTKRSEATRISAKLGPLPPLPVQYDVINETNISHPRLHDSNDRKFDYSQITCTTSRTTPPIRNVARNQPIMSTPVCRPSETVHHKRPTANFLNEEVDLLKCRVRSKNNMCISDFTKTDAYTSYVTGTRNVDENTKVDCFIENSNIYFILEPASDVSSLNSDSEDTTDCHHMRNHNFR